MRKIFLAIFAMVICSTVLAQLPQAFKYQAVVRDYRGYIIADQDINLKISILKGTDSDNIVYSETHPVLTNSLGLVNIEVGRGLSPSGNFSDINWAEASYFIKVEMDEYGGQNYRTIGVAQLLSVPYALHSGTASNLLSTDSYERGIPAQAWSLFGNSNSSPPIDKLGTTDMADLMLVTNNIERLRIKSDGDVAIARSLNIGEDLTVENNVFLNTFGGETNNYGPFTVANQSPSLLSGTLTVDLATDLNSSLNVDGITDLNSSFSVNNNSPSVLTGSLLVEGDAIFNQNVTLTDTIPSVNAFSGTLVVAGGVGIGKDLNVAGSASFGGPLALTDTTESVDIYTGALRLAGGAGIQKRLNVGGAVNVGGATTLENILDVNGQVTIHANPGTGSQSSYTDYPLLVEGGQQGIAIKVNGSRSSVNNYISFWDDQGVNGVPKLWGNIQGQTLDNLRDDPDYKFEKRLKDTELSLSYIEFGLASLQSVQGVFEAVCASTSTTVCAGAGLCVTSPIPSLIIGAVSKIVVLGLIHWERTASQVVTQINYSDWLAKNTTNIGVTYQSGAGDYAEWLPKEDPGAHFTAGEVVGLRNGFVSRNLATADRIMVVSTNPIVLGNMPPEGQEDRFVKIAFMGQVPVQVLGNVKPGDYILPSEFGNGFGKAVHPDKMELIDYKNIVGVAWSDMQVIAPGVSLVNVAVGINTNDLTDVIIRQEEKLSALRTDYELLKAEIERSNSVLAGLVPGYAEATGFKPTANQSFVSRPDHSIPMPSEANIVYPSPEDIIYFDIPRQQLEAGLDAAREIYNQAFENKGVLSEFLFEDPDVTLDLENMFLKPIEEHPFWKKIDSNPEFKEAFLQHVEKSLEKSIYTQRKYIDRFAGSDMKLRID